jgi:glycerol-3-phosphate acyltransferase PlsY
VLIEPPFDALVTLLAAYLLGSIPFGVVLTRLAGAGDLTAIGSGNIGATNVLRTGRKGLAALTLILDGAKGAAAVLLARALFPDQEHLLPLAAVGAFLGHLYPVWLGFRGGKGVATLFGIMAALHWPSGLIYAAVWIGTLALSRISSLGGLLAAASGPIAAAAFGRFDLALLYLGFALIVFWKHGENIGRLLAGTEPRIGSGKGAAGLDG